MHRKSLIKLISFSVAALLLLLFVVPPLTRINRPPASMKDYNLEFGEDSFKILQVTDFHENNGLSEQISASLDVMLDLHNPDLVVLTGDIVFPVSVINEWLFSHSLNVFDQIGEYFEVRQVHWSVVFGNHDDEGIYSKTQYLKRCAAFEFFVGGFDSGTLYESFIDEENNAVGNFKIPVYNKGQLQYNLFLMDSGSQKGHRKFSENYSHNYNVIRQPATDWFIEQAKDGVPSLVFTHIPMPQFDEAFSQENDYVGIFRPNAYSDLDSPFFDAALNNNVMGIFVGHMHNLTLTTFYKSGNNKIITSNCKSFSQNETIEIGAKLIELTANDLIVSNLNQNGEIYDYFSYLNGAIINN